LFSRYNGRVDESKQPIPMSEAINRGLMPCASCGATGAALRKVGKGESLLCAKCVGRGGTWTWILAGLTFAVVALVVLLLRMRSAEQPDGPPGAPLPPSARDPEPWLKETNKLLRQGRFREARERTQDLLDKMPKEPVLNITMGRCLMNLGATDAAIPYLLVAAKSDLKADAVVFLGMAYKKIGHAAEALPYLEQPLSTEAIGKAELAEVYLDLERYDDALRLLADASGRGALWARHRALLYGGKPDEAAALLEGRDEDEVASLRAGQRREAGDFAGALKIIEAQTAKVAPGTSTWYQLRRSERSLAVESGDLARLEAVAAALDADKDPSIQAEGAFTRAISHLLAGRRDPAKTAAWEFLAKSDKENSTLRLERLMMRHLAGELKTADLEAEATLLSRFHANDLLWYLALESGDRARAEKALTATPGHNYPYHSIRRLLKP
jgi:tetratricopeptide (TPR) repeat protein